MRMVLTMVGVLLRVSPGRARVSGRSAIEVRDCGARRRWIRVSRGTDVPGVRCGSGSGIVGVAPSRKSSCVFSLTIRLSLPAA
jgi:hypothetical protein